MFAPIAEKVPPVRGRLRENVPLAPYTWLRVGGAAQLLFIPADRADLSRFLGALPKEIPVTILGVASNTLVRDGGVPGVTIRLGPNFAKITQESDVHIRAGAACLDSVLARAAAKMGIAGLEFYAGVPGTIGGALRMNAGCYGAETCDIVREITAMDRSGRIEILTDRDMQYAYRHCGAPPDLIFLDAVFEGTSDWPEAITARMDEITARRELAQPIREKTGGSTFKNPDGDKGAWQVIDAAGGRGLKIGGAQMSTKHCNFMINTGDATAADLENLGELVREKVKASQGIELHWEVRRIGVPA